MVERTRRGLKVVRLRKPVPADDSKFLDTLVWVLDAARRGKIKGYSMIFVVNADGHERTIEAASPFKDLDKMTVLGMIRRMEYNFVRREWPEDGMVDEGNV